MKRFVLLCSVFAFGISFVFPVLAANEKAVEKSSAQNSIVLMDSLAKLNRIKPLQNPLMRKSEAVLGRTVIDRQNKIIGKVDDLLIDGEGRSQSLLVAFDRLRLQQPVFINYKTTKITPSSNGYKIGYEAEEVAAMYPELLANIETAAGNDDILSLKNVLHKVVVNDQGVEIGDISNVLLNEKGEYVEAFFITLNTGGMRSKSLAVPFEIIVFEESRGVKQGRILQHDLDTVLKFAKG